MNERELHARFRELGFELPHSSIKRWSLQGLLPQPDVDRSRGVGGGRGRTSDWREATVEQAAAIYAIRNQGYPGRKKRIAPDTISTIRGFANTFFAWLEEYRDNIADPLLNDFCDRFFTAINVKVPSDYVKETDRRNDKGAVWGWRFALFDEAREALAAKWIATVEKVALGVPLTIPVAIRYYFGRVPQKMQDPEENVRFSLCYLLSTAVTSEADKVQVIALSFSELEELPQVVTEDDAFLGAKWKANDWIKAKDTGDQSAFKNQLTAWISSHTEHPLAEVGAA